MALCICFYEQFIICAYPGLTHVKDSFVLVYLIATFNRSLYSFQSLLLNFGHLGQHLHVGGCEYLILNC